MPGHTCGQRRFAAHHRRGIFSRQFWSDQLTPILRVKPLRLVRPDSGLATGRLKADEFRKATPYNEAFYQSMFMFMVKDFWAVPEFAELLTAANKRWHPFVVGGKGTAEDAQNGLAKDWDAIFKKYGRVK